MLGLTQHAVATACGVSFQQIQKYECAVSKLSAAKLWEISQALNVEVGYFFDGLSAEEQDRSARTVVRTQAWSGERV